MYMVKHVHVYRLIVTEVEYRISIIDHVSLATHAFHFGGEGVSFRNTSNKDVRIGQFNFRSARCDLYRLHADMKHDSQI